MACRPRLGWQPAVADRSFEGACSQAQRLTYAWHNAQPSVSSQVLRGGQQEEESGDLVCALAAGEKEEVPRKLAV